MSEELKKHVIKLMQEHRKKFAPASDLYTKERFWINTEAATLQEILQSERERRQQETEEFMYKETLRCVQARQKVTHELEEFFNKETDDE
jgi:hypothetical protein